jgi:hypothetical protein
MPLNCENVVELRGFEPLASAAEIGSELRRLSVMLLRGIAGCTGAPERSEEATKLQPELGTLPGVDGASDPYENAIGRGASLLVDVSMPDATDPKGTWAGCPRRVPFGRIGWALRPS